MKRREFLETLTATAAVPLTAGAATAPPSPPENPGGPTTLEGALSSPTTLGGEAPRSMRVTVSSAGFGGTVLTPLTSTAL